MRPPWPASGRRLPLRVRQLLDTLAWLGALLLLAAAIVLGLWLGG
jgi:hypothetical protein